MGKFVFLRWTVQLHCCQKKTFCLPFLDTNQFFAMKIANQHDKHFTQPKSWDQDSFFEPGFGISSNSNHRARTFATPWHSNQCEYLDSLVYNISRFRTQQMIIVSNQVIFVYSQPKVWCLLKVQHYIFGVGCTFFVLIMQKMYWFYFVCF